MINKLRKMLDPGKPSFTPNKAKPSVVMFVGLQGIGGVLIPQSDDTTKVPLLLLFGVAKL
ncbi:Dynamin-2A [Prunus dulcis]|uniref:Dynamin-2A n=1 Tax=Prunus dulcis TaxID=3755 RepID=A0A4Y1R4Q7_PRUDU|nr:Dynamin-2A [Prunus dulcis]